MANNNVERHTTIMLKAAVKEFRKFPAVTQWHELEAAMLCYQQARKGTTDRRVAARHARTPAQIARWCTLILSGANQKDFDDFSARCEG